MIPFAHGLTEGNLEELAPRQLAQDILRTVNELTDIIVAENDALSMGYPAGLTASSERKTELSAEYAELWDELGPEGAAQLARDPEFGHLLTEAVRRLRNGAQENMVRLEAAMAASRRRVEAVLSALREDAGTGAPYGKKGEIPLDLRLPPVGMNFHA